MTTTAYLRVSTDGQDLEKNKADILTFANNLHLGHVKFEQEKVSGKVSWHTRKIATIVEQSKKGDSIIVSEFSRLGRSMLECMEILSICMQKGICVYAVKGAWKLDNSIQSKIVAMVFSMVAEIERDLISQRTIEALAARKAAGVKLGRTPGPGKSKLDLHREEIVALLNNGSTQTWVAHRYKTSRENLHHWLKQRKIVIKK